MKISLCDIAKLYAFVCSMCISIILFVFMYVHVAVRQSVASKSSDIIVIILPLVQNCLNRHGIQQPARMIYGHKLNELTVGTDESG